MEYILKTDSSVLVVSLVDMKAYLQVDFSTDDDLITSLIKTATRYIENYTHRDLINKTYTLYLDFFGDNYGCENYQTIYRHKLQSITSIKYYSNETLTTFASANYSFIKSDNNFQYIYLKENVSFPDTDNLPQTIEIEFIAGFGTTVADVPDDYKIMIKRLVAYLYNFRGDCIDGNIDLNHSSLIGLKSLLDMKEIIYL
jgi:uncharacterized phiE125 gp8 family phage protein